MNADDFQDLYKLLRGSKSAFGVLDARTLFIEKKMQAALAKMIDSRDGYAQSRSRLMKQDAKDQVDPKSKDADRQIKRLERKQDKVREILEKFEEAIPALEKLAKREKERQQSVPQETVPDQESDIEAEVNKETDQRPANPADVSVEFAARFMETEGDKQLELISRHFGFRPVESEDDIFPNSVYYILIREESFLVHTCSEEKMGDGVPLASVIDATPMKTYSIEAFIKLGARRRMVLLTTSNATPESWPDAVEIDADSVQFDVHRETREDISAETVANIDPEAAKSDDGSELTVDDFSQLMESVQRTGLSSDVEQIGHYRDREFRLGCYDACLDEIGSIFSTFNSAVADLRIRLAREEKGLEAGEVKMSPEELEAKRAGDRQKVDAIKLAVAKFRQVINGLQVLTQENSP